MKHSLFIHILLLLLFNYVAFAQETLWYDGFEDETSGWQFLDIDGDGRNWAVSDINPYRGLHCLYGSYSPTAEDNWAVSPAVPIPDDGGMTTVEWEVFAHANYIETYEILVTTGTGNVLALYDSVFAESVTGGYHSRQVPLNGYAGQTVRIAIRHLSQNQNFICIDDVSIRHYEQLPPQPPVVSIAAPATAMVGEVVTMSAQCSNAEQFQWDIEGTEPSNSEGRTTTAEWERAGRYRVSLTATNADGSTTADHIISILDKEGFVPAAKQPSHMVYPNPASESIHILPTTFIKVSIFNSAGKEVASSTQSDVSISSLPKGVYQAVITTTEGVVVENIIKR
ncbi:MAG: choice-of-anchor J domain-containing protein [Bacteroidales bacterium]|nr:choice-of-anchor J domain-containing protein [Bacteroidales bacterium]